MRWIAPLGMGPTAIGFWRMLLGGIMLGSLALLRGVSFRTDARALGFTALSGLCFASDLFVWHRSILSIGAGMGTLLANTQVFWVAAFGIAFLGERPGWKFWLALPLGAVYLGSAIRSVPK